MDIDMYIHTSRGAGCSPSSTRPNPVYFQAARVSRRTTLNLLMEECIIFHNVPDSRDGAIALRQVHELPPIVYILQPEISIHQSCQAILILDRPITPSKPQRPSFLHITKSQDAYLKVSIRCYYSYGHCRSPLAGRRWPCRRS
jgi:hypothetical protein